MKTPVKQLRLLLGAAFLSATTFLATGCDPECVDDTDCARDEQCTDGACVARSGGGGGGGGDAQDAGGGGGGAGGGQGGGGGGGADDGGFDGGDDGGFTGDGGTDDGGFVDDGGTGDGGVLDAGFVDAGFLTFNVRMKTDQVVPPNTGAAVNYWDGGFGGTLNLNVMEDGGHALFWAFFAQATPVTNPDVPGTTQSFVARGPGGRNGTQVFTFTPTYDPTTGFAIANGTVTLSTTQAQGLVAGDWYAQFNTVGNPDGELRGQITMPGEKLYIAILNGANEVPANTSAATGGGHVIVPPDAGLSRYWAQWDALDGGTSGAHIHGGDAGETGGVVWGLDVFPDGGGARGTIDAGVLNPNVLDAERYYLNAHSPAYPDGEIRGQLKRAD